MGVEGKDKAKVLGGGAAALSNQLGQAVQRLRKSYGLSLADLSQLRGRQVDHFADRAQRDQSDADDDWRLAHALDVDRIDASGRRRGAVHRASEPRDDADLRLRRRTVPARGDRLDQDGGLAAMVRFQADPGGVLESTAHLRGSIECLSALEGELEVEVGGRARRRRRDVALPLRHAPSHPQPRRKPAHATMVCILKAAMMD